MLERRKVVKKQTKKKLYTFTTYQTWRALVWWLNPALTRQSEETEMAQCNLKGTKGRRDAFHEAALKFLLDLQAQIALPPLISGTSHRAGIVCLELWKEDLTPYLPKADYWICPNMYLCVTVFSLVLVLIWWNLKKSGKDLEA